MKFNKDNLRPNAILKTKSFEPPQIFKELRIVEILNDEEFIVESGDGKVRATWCFAYLKKCNYTNGN